MAFNGCAKLKAIRLPELSGSLRNIIGNCASLEILELPKITEIAASAAVLSFAPVKELCLPSCKTVGGWSVLASYLVKVDLPVCTYIGDSAFYSDYVLKYLLLRSPEKCTFTASSLDVYVGGVHSSTVMLFVPSVLLEEYKADANLAPYVDRIFQLEDFTADGTKDGEFGYYTVTNNLTNVTTSNEATVTGPRAYSAVLTFGGVYNVKVAVAMDGVDVTGEVYNAETGEINIPKVTGNIVISASCQLTEFLQLYVYQGSLSYDGENPGYAIIDAATRVCTDLVPFTNNDRVVISMTNTTYQVTLRGYDGNKVYKASSGVWDTLPGNISFNYPYLRFIIGTSANSNISVTDFDGATLTVGDTTYRLVATGG